jgi:hypothetical protein
LNRLDPRTGRFAHFLHRPGDPATLSHDSVYGMAEGPEGNLWVGTQIGRHHYGTQPINAWG